MLKALTMTTVVCNPESPGGWKDANTKCMGCGREVYCNPLFENAGVKLCVRCAECKRFMKYSYLPEIN